MARKFRLTALALVAAMVLPSTGMAERWDRGRGHDRGRHEGGRGDREWSDYRGRRSPSYGYAPGPVIRRGSDAVPLIGGALLGLGLGAVLGGPVVPGYAAPVQRPRLAPQYAPPPPAYYAPGKPASGY